MIRIFIIEKNPSLSLFYETLFNKEAKVYTHLSFNNEWYILDDFLPTILIVDLESLEQGAESFFYELEKKDYAFSLKIFLTKSSESPFSLKLFKEINIFEKPLEPLEFKRRILEKREN